jgi:hypothetical protein
MVETLALHERLALYNLTDEEIEKIEEELVKHFPREEFAEIHIEVWQIYEETGALQIHKLIEAKYPTLHLYIFHHKIVEVLMNLQPINVTDDFLSKKEQVKIALDLIIENRPEWFYKAYQRNGNA